MVARDLARSFRRVTGKPAPAMTWILLALLVSVSSGQFLYNLRAGQGYLSENQQRLSHYHFLYLLFAGLLGLFLIAVFAWIAARVCDMSFRDSFRERALSSLVLLLLLPVSFTAFPRDNLPKSLYAVLVFAAALLCTLLLMFRAAERRGRRAHFTICALLLALVALAFALRVCCFFTVQRYVDSDEATIGLMARHILYEGARPILFYGSAYNSAIDAYVSALLFFFLGPVSFALKLSAMLPLLLALPLVYLVGRTFHDYRTGLAAAFLLAVAPANLVVISTQQLGGFSWSLFLTALSLLLLLKTGDRGYMERRPFLPWFLVGALCGLMFYVQPLNIPTIAAILLFAVVRHGRRPLVPLLAGSLVGCAPLVLYNLVHPLATLTDLRARTTPLNVWQLKTNLQTVAMTSFPLMLGLRSSCDSRLLAPAWLAVPLYLLVLCSLPYLLVRVFGLFGKAAAHPADRGTAAELDGAFLCLAFIVLGLAFYSLSSYVVINPEYPRQLIALYVPLYLGLGYFLFRVVDACGERFGGAGACRLATACVLLLFAGLAALYGTGMADLAKCDTCFAYNRRSSRELIDFLEENGLENIYTGYWTAYKAAFESAERICASPAAGPVKMDRYPPYTERVDGSERIAVVFEDYRFRSLELMEQGLAAEEIGFRRTVVGNFVVFWDFSRRPDIYRYGLPE